MMIRHPLALLTVLFLGPTSHVTAAPKLDSHHPIGGQRGTSLEVELRGSALQGAHAVWLGADGQTSTASTKSLAGIEARLTAVPNASHAKVRLDIAASARLGFHSFALISPSGLSNNVSFWVADHPVIVETGEAHQTWDTAQPVKLPMAVQGKISASGQLDYYAFDIDRPQSVAFEVIALSGKDFDPQLALYEAGGSFLDSRRSKRLLFNEEITQGSMPVNRRLTYQFTKPARYVVNIGNLLAQGGGDSSYLLRIAPAETTAEDALAWARGRLRGIHARAVEAPALDISLLREVEPNDKPEQSQAVSVPMVIEGGIGRPGDIDRFRFKAKAGQKITFELQSPRASAPQFNPRLDILNAKGDVELSNAKAQVAKIGTEDSMVILLVSQVTGSLEREEEYTLRIRNLTSLHSSKDHVYRVLVRPQVPHVGAIKVQPDGPINLAPGGRHRLTLNMSLQEGFAGTAALSVEGLPAGVKAFVTNNSVELLADARATHTPLPNVLRIWGLPSAAGKSSGAAFLVAEIPIMVVK